MKKIEEVSNFSSAFEEVSPVEMTIEETLRLRADERRRKLKDFNYKFHNNPSRLDEWRKNRHTNVMVLNYDNQAVNNFQLHLVYSNNDTQLNNLIICSLR